ncbi:hypothetical protein [Streptosporangium sp. OZ121]
MDRLIGRIPGTAPPDEPDEPDEPDVTAIPGTGEGRGSFLA